MEQMKKTDQQFYSQAELAELWHCSPKKIGLMRKYNILHPVRIGKCFLFSQKDIDQMFETYAGFDLSNEEKIRKAKQIVTKGIN